MAIFLTGGTGYIGSYIVTHLLPRTEQSIYLLTREPSREKLWRALQMHMSPDEFRAAEPRLVMLKGDLTHDGLGLSTGDTERVVAEVDSVIHCAASLNRKSEKACLNANLKGTLAVLDLTRKVQVRRPLRRFSYVSTVAVAGQRKNETIMEEMAIDWRRSDYDPYGRTKKFCEHMIRTLLPDTSVVVFRPSVVLGDSRKPATTQFDMVQAFAFLAQRAVLPLRSKHKLDIVPANYVGEAIADVHMQESPEFSIYHLSSGRQSPTYREIVEALAAARGQGTPWFWPWMQRPFGGVTRTLGRWFYGTQLGTAASRLSVFYPYLTYNTVFENTRIVSSFGHAPASFPTYCAPLLKWSLEHKFRYPYRDLPA